jgi:hypothetical protein
MKRFNDRLHFSAFGEGTFEIPVRTQALIDETNRQYVEAVSQELRALDSVAGNWRRNAQGWVTVINVLGLTLNRLLDFHPSGKLHIMARLPQGPLKRMVKQFLYSEDDA